jgi:hypothetical protein
VEEEVVVAVAVEVEARAMLREKVLMIFGSRDRSKVEMILI